MTADMRQTCPKTSLEPSMKVLPIFQKEAEALARIIAMRLDPARYDLTSDAPPAVARLIAEALQSAYVDARYEGGDTNRSEFDSAIEFAGYVTDPTLSNWVGRPPSNDLLNLAKQFLALAARLKSE